MHHDMDDEIQATISSILTTRTAAAHLHGADFSALWKTTVECVSGGKLLRPRILVGAFDAFCADAQPGLQTRESVLQMAAALEILHFSFLLHDDIIDDDLMRRGEANLMGRLLVEARTSPWPVVVGDELPARRLHWARNAGLLVGDLMLTLAHQLFARVQVDRPSRLRILDLLDATVTETVAGEYCDVSLADGYLGSDPDLVLKMTCMKTAAYTFELPLRLAAVLAGAQRSAEDQLGQVGRRLGVAFQLQDDLRSAFETSNVHGKDDHSDFREGKETALIAYARSTSAWEQLRPLLGTQDFLPSSAPTIQCLLTECGARKFVESKVADQVEAAMQVLMDGDGELPTAVRDFCHEIIGKLDSGAL